MADSLIVQLHGAQRAHLDHQANIVAVLGRDSNAAHWHAGAAQAFGVAIEMVARVAAELDAAFNTALSPDGKIYIANVRRLIELKLNDPQLPPLVCKNCGKLAVVHDLDSSECPRTRWEPA